MADWFIATEGVKVVKDSASLWPQIITAVSTIGAAMGGVALTHRFTLKREEAAAKEKLASERLFIATELIIILERFADECAQEAINEGETIIVPGGQNFRKGINSDPAPPDYEKVAGDWRSLPPMLMYRIRELPVLRNEAMRVITSTRENDTGMLDDYYPERQYQYAWLGLKSIGLARELRRICELQRSSFDYSSSWSPHAAMLDVLRRELKRRNREPKDDDFTL
ncbi:hypothetical protein [Cronobacter dublinensis]|uniref:hypothetical protein n=1 Tax=Cronobacter dublinensis TaxID=413497 RepID=UPI0018F877C3|nr:hypothetical protein [Cronobacter dublinensis]